jgi:hypothetical protein
VMQIMKSRSLQKQNLDELPRYDIL